MSLKAKLYIAMVIGAGSAILLLTAIADPRLPDWGHFLHFLVLALLASTFKIRLPGMQSSISLNFVLFLIGIAGLSLIETLVMAALATTVQTFWRARTRPKFIQALFNVAALLISVFAAFVLTAQLRNGRGHVPGLVIAGVIFFVVNSWLISLILAFIEGGSALNIWRTCHRWAFPYYFVGAVLAVVVSVYAQVCGWAMALAMLPSVYLLYAYYDTQLKNAGTSDDVVAA